MADKATVHILGLGTRVPEETTLETLMTLGDGPASFAVLPAGRPWDWLKSQCPGLRRTQSPAAVLAAARRFGEARAAVPGHLLFEGEFAGRLIATCRKQGVKVKTTPSVSPVASAFAQAELCLGGNYGYQGIQSYSLRRLLSDPGAYSPRLPLVVYGGAEAAAWKRLGGLLAARLPGTRVVHAYPAAGRARKTTLARLGAALRSGGSALIAPSAPPADPGERE